MVWLALAAIPVVAAYWLRLFGRFVDGESERDPLDALRLALLGVSLAFLLVHAFAVALAAAGLQGLLALPRPRLIVRHLRDSVGG